jgi:protein-disulfide isomerase
MEITRVNQQINTYLDTHPRPMLGEVTAPITIAIFSDLQCPFCKEAMRVLTKEILPAFEKKIRIV